VIVEKRVFFAFIRIFSVVALASLAGRPALVLGSEEFDDISHLKNVKFKIIDEATGEPLKNRELNICQFVYFKLKPGAPSPYLDKGADWFITLIKTDGQGIFFLDLSKIEVHDIVAEPGPPYNIVHFERSSNIRHNKSANHIRVVQFEAGTTRVASNMVYDLKRKIVKIIPIFGGQAQEKPYDQILLVTKKLKNVLYQKQDSISNALEFIGTPEDRMKPALVSKRGQLAGPGQLEFANKLFSVRKSKDVDMYKSLLSDGTKKLLSDSDSKMLQSHIQQIKEGTFLYGKYDCNFFITFRELCRTTNPYNRLLALP